MASARGDAGVLGLLVIVGLQGLLFLASLFLLGSRGGLPWGLGLLGGVIALGLLLLFRDRLPVALAGRTGGRRPLFSRR